ncbi:MAG: transketolase [Burkholderiaceae bacterium]|jgi:transketolase
MTASLTIRMANAIRALAMDAVQKANSGHPGMPMGMADIAVALWKNYLRFNPANPEWLNRDRFVLSNGHGSMLQYALLHLTGYALPMEELENFRQLHSKTPGHPERGITPGVETTTGPLGQGLANGVGMALTEKLLAAEFNRPGFEIVDHRTYVFAGDGCMMEGISHEAASLAGKWRLGKLIVVYDDNGISIDGEVTNWFTDDTAKRFEAYGWHVERDINGKDGAAICAAFERAQKSERPTFIMCKTVIGEGAPHLQGTEKAHGSALGEAEVKATREALGWEYPPFVIPEDLYAAWDSRARGARLEGEWQDLFAHYRERFPQEASEFERRALGRLPRNWAETSEALIRRTLEKKETVATRKSSQQALDALAPALPELLGGSADLTPSNLTQWDKAVTLRVNDGIFQPGHYVNYGVREFGMSAILNGVACHGGLIPFGGTFLTFSDYSRNALRMSALMKIRSIFVFTHDSIGLGEDGPTHQSIEHLSSLRLIPHMDLWRPADTTETAIAWIAAVERADGPSSLVFSRQNLPYLEKTTAQVENIRKGAYVLADVKVPRAILIATGSEVGLAMKAQRALAELGISVRVVSMPSTSVFDRQSQEYKSSVLPDGPPRIAIEAGVTDFWWKYVRGSGAVIGIDTFGESAPGDALFKFFHFTVENVVATVQHVL